MNSTFTKRFIELLRHPAVLVSLGVIAVISIAQSLLITPFMASLALRLGPMLGPANMAVGLLMFALLAAIQFHLSRRLGEHRAPVRAATLGAWLGFTILYLVLTKVPAGIASSFFMLTMMGDVHSFALAMTLTVFIIRVALFPLLVHLTALAQDSGRRGFGGIANGLARRPALCGGYALLCLAFAALSLLPVWLGPGAASRPLFITIALLSALGQVLLIVYTIASYHTIQADDTDTSHVFE